MKAIRIIPSVACVMALGGAAPAPGATDRVSPQRGAAAGGVVLAGDYQVPVEEAVEPIERPAPDARKGDNDAVQQPAAEEAPPADRPPPADVPPAVQQPSVEP